MPNRNALVDVETAQDYLAANSTAEREGQLGGAVLEPLIDRVSSAIASYLGRRTIATTAYPFTAVAATDVLTTTAAHGLVAGMEVGIWAPLFGNLPTGLAADTLYYVLTAPSATTLTLSTSAGGGTVDVTAAGDGGYIARLERHVLPGDGGAMLPLYRQGLYPVDGIHSLTLQVTSQTIPKRATVMGTGWIAGDEGRWDGIIRLAGYATDCDPEAVLLYGRFGLCPVEAQRLGLWGDHHQQALDDLRQACLMWAGKLWSSPVPIDQLIVDGVTTTFSPSEMPIEVRGLLSPYRLLRFG